LMKVDSSLLFLLWSILLSYLCPQMCVFHPGCQIYWHKVSIIFSYFFILARYVVVLLTSGRGQRYCYTSHKTWGSPHKELTDPNVSSTKGKESCHGITT
jgi:hypothetical protein